MAGIVVVAGFYTYEYWATSSGQYPTSPASWVSLSIIGNVGFILIFMGAIFAGINWSLLRKRRSQV